MNTYDSDLKNYSKKLGSKSEVVGISSVTSIFFHTCARVIYDKNLFPNEFEFSYNKNISLKELFNKYTVEVLGDEKGLFCNFIGRFSLYHFILDLTEYSMSPLLSPLKYLHFFRKKYIFKSDQVQKYKYTHTHLKHLLHHVGHTDKFSVLSFKKNSGTE